MEISQLSCKMEIIRSHRVYFQIFSRVKISFAYERKNARNTKNIKYVACSVVSTSSTDQSQTMMAERSVFRVKKYFTK